MSRGPSTFRQTDVTRAIKAAKAAGVDVSRIEIGPNGRIVITAGPVEPTKSDAQGEIVL